MLKLVFALIFSSLAADSLDFAIIDFRPYGYLQDQEPQGLYVDIAKQLSSLSGQNFQFNVVPFARAKEGIIKGRFAYTMMFESEDLKVKSDKLCELLSINSILYASQYPISSWSEINGKKVGRIRGGCKDLENTSGLQVRFMDVNDVAQAMELLKLKRIDTFCIDQITVQNYLDDHGMDSQSVKRSFVFSKRKVALFASKNLPEGQKSQVKEACKGKKMKTFLDQISSRLGLGHTFQQSQSIKDSQIR